MSNISDQISNQVEPAQHGDGTPEVVMTIPRDPSKPRTVEVFNGPNIEGQSCTDLTSALEASQGVVIDRQMKAHHDGEDARRTRLLDGDRQRL